jgi:hypothetical protein
MEGEPMTTSRPEREPDTVELADLPVEQPLPPDAPERASAAVDEAGKGTGPRSVMAAYEAALAAGRPSAAAGLFADNGRVVTPEAQHSGSGEVLAFHEQLLADGPVLATAGGQGNDAGRLALDDGGGPYAVVELSFDAAGRIGTARWLDRATAERPQEERERRPR